jgi:hypothetical protein
MPDSQATSVAPVGRLFGGRGFHIAGCKTNHLLNRKRIKELERQDSGGAAFIFAVGMSLAFPPRNYQPSAGKRSRVALETFAGMR